MEGFSYGEHYDENNWSDDIVRRIRDGFAQSHERKVRDYSEKGGDIEKALKRGLDLIAHSAPRKVDGEERDIIRQLKTAVGSLIEGAPDEALPMLVEAALKAAFFYGLRKGKKESDE